MSAGPLQSPRRLSLVALSAWVIAVTASALPSRPGFAQDATTDDAPAHLAELDLQEVERVRITLTITRALSPYAEVRYELRNRGQTLLLSLTKQLAGGFGMLDDVSLLSIDDLPQWWSALSECGVDTLSTRPETASDHTGSGTHYDLEVTLGDFHRQAGGDLGDTTPDSPLWCASELIVQAYHATGDPVPFQNLFFAAGEYGELTTQTDPPARLFVDGRDTGLVTPVRAMRLLPGAHELRFVNAELQIDRTYEATVEVGLTTQLDIALR